MLTYPLFLAISGAALAVLERLWPRNRAQKLLRRGLAWDLALLLLNSEVTGAVVAMALTSLIPTAILAPYRVASLPFWAELLTLWIVKDLVQWCVHYALHHVPLLWRIHKLHHTSEEMDWLSNWRFNPLEVPVYQTALYIPAYLLGFRPEVVMLCAFLSTGIGHFAHANLSWRMGPLKYVFNTPELHVWHHVHPQAGPVNRNFCVSFAFWDWMFGTAYCPPQAPERLGVES